MLDLTLAALISLLDTLLSISYAIILIGSIAVGWIFTVGIFTKPHNDTVKDHLKFFFKHSNDTLEVNLGFVESKLLNRAIDSARWIVVDYYCCKFVQITISDRVSTRKLEFVGALNTWYYLGIE